MDEFRTIDGESRTDLKIKASRFCAAAFPATSVTEFEKRLATERKTTFDATHHCYAFSIGHPPAIVQRFNDDGEPSGTAGKPILLAIRAHELTNVGVIVTRYFGGTKLGSGGLARAYREATDAALAAATIRVEVLRDPLMLRFRYDELSAVMRTAEATDSVIERTDYADTVTMNVLVRRSLVETVRRRFIDATRGQVEFP